MERTTVESAHERVDELLIELREHLVHCAGETRQQNARLQRVARILIGTAGAPIMLLFLSF